MGDTPLIGSDGDNYKDSQKRRRPGRDKESRMKDLSDDESSGDSDNSFGKEKSVLIKSSKGQGNKIDLKAKESKSYKDYGKSKGKGSSKHRSSDKHKKHKQKYTRLRGSSRSSSWSSDCSSKAKESKTKSRLMEKKLKLSIIKRMAAKMQGPPESIKVSIARKKYENLMEGGETQKTSSLEFESTGESSLVHKSIDDPNKIEAQVKMQQGKSMDKHKTSSCDVERKIGDPSENSSSSESGDILPRAVESKHEKDKILKDAKIKRMKNMRRESLKSIKVSIDRNKYERFIEVDETQKSASDLESGDISPRALESKHESPKKDKILKDAKIKRMKNMRRESLKSIKVSIDRTKYERLIEVDETQKSASDLEHGESSPLKKALKEDTNEELQLELAKLPNAADKVKEKQDKPNDKKRDVSDSQSQETCSTSLSESVDADSQNQEQSKEISCNSDKLKNSSIEAECAIVGDNIFQAEISLDIKKDDLGEKEVKKNISASRSSSSSDDSSREESNNIINAENKGSLKMEKKDDLHFRANRKDNEKERKFSKSSESSNSSSDSESSGPKTKYARRSRDKKREKEMEKTMKKEKSGIKRISSKDKKGKNSRKGHGSGRKNSKRGLSVSSTSSSSSKSFSDSSSSTSGSSSSGSTSRSSSASKDRSSSSSSSSSSGRRHKRSFKTKEKAKKHHSRTPLNSRRKSIQPPRPKKIHVGHLSKSINKFHLYEIFGLFGIVKNVDLPLDRTNGHTPRGFAYVEYNHASDAEKALRHMDGGLIDGHKIAIAPVLPYKPRPIPPRRMSPNRRNFLNWRHTPFRNRGGGAMMNFGGRDRRRRIPSPPRRRPLRRTRSRSPNRRPRVRHRSVSSSR